MRPLPPDKKRGELAKDRQQTVGRAIVVGPYARGEPGAPSGESALAVRSPAARLDEAVGLALAIDLDVAKAILVPLRARTPATYIGSGKAAELSALVAGEGAELVIMDCALSPVQQRNLERAWGAKVLDRTALILEIFGRRARTREGRLQVEHAHLSYQRSRLVRSWTHLERQRGGFGFLGGPGETQLETDRRLISERLAKIETELATVKRTRKLHRESRKRVPFPVVSLVGYTNAGKSTLFNRLTQAKVLEADMLFATLDPTLRTVKLPDGTPMILSDTVGFISDLPTMLVAAFRATLEEVIEADLILHVRDASHEDTEAQAADVGVVLQSLGIDQGDPSRVLQVWNKIDLLDDEGRDRLANAAGRQPAERRPILTSALSGDGTRELLERLGSKLSGLRETISVSLNPEDGAGLSWLHRQGQVKDQRMGTDGQLVITVEIPVSKAAAVVRKFPDAVTRAPQELGTPPTP